MKPIPILLLALPRVAFRRAALQTLKREVSADQAADIWQTAKGLQSELRKSRPKHSFGLNMLLRFFEWDCALFLAAKRAGMTTEIAGPMVEETNWTAFGPAFELSFAASRLRSKHLRTRVEWILDWMFGVLFTSPFQRTAVPAAHDVAFNVTVCPLAQYFHQRGVPELTPYAACGLDYRMAAIWGVRLERTQTIARGNSMCDFRFKIHGQSESGKASDSTGRDGDGGALPR